jgi:hypothetical protein
MIFSQKLLVNASKHTPTTKSIAGSKHNRKTAIVLSLISKADRKRAKRFDFTLLNSIV